MFASALHTREHAAQAVNKRPYVDLAMHRGVLFQLGDGFRDKRPCAVRVAFLKVIAAGRGLYKPVIECALRFRGGPPDVLQVLVALEE